MAKYLVHKAIEVEAISAKQRAVLEKNEVWEISPKYDGCHAIVCFASGKHGGTFSRSGERVLSMDHIATFLLDHYPEIKNAETITICGEAWTVGKQFNEISGMFRRHSKQPELGFVPFDMVPYDMDDFGLPILGQFDGRKYPAIYSRRIAALVGNFIPRSYSNVYRPRRTQFVGTLSNALAYAAAEAKVLKARTDSYFDGAVLANGNAAYNVCDGKDGAFIKAKPLISESVKVVQLHAARGDKTGKHTLALGFHFNGVYQKVSTGLTQAEVDSYIADPTLIHGKVIEVGAMGLTVNGAFREPRYLGIRTDVIL